MATETHGPTGFSSKNARREIWEILAFWTQSDSLPPSHPVWRPFAGLPKQDCRQAPKMPFYVSQMIISRVFKTV